MRSSSKATYADDKCTIDFNLEKQFAPAILTRFPNPHHRKLPVTIINSDFGAAVYQLTAALTDEERFKTALEFLKSAPPFPDTFQLLCGVRFSVVKEVTIYALAARKFDMMSI